MEKISQFLESKLLPLGNKLNSIRFLQVIRMSMMPTIPFIIAGSFVLIILNFPYIDKVIPVEVMTVLSNILSPITTTTLSIVALFLAFLIGYNYAKIAYEETEPIYVGITTLVGFLTLTPLTIIVGKEAVGGVIPIANIGSKGMFVALLGGYLIAKLYCFILKKGIKVRLPDSVPPMVSDSFESLIPATLTLIAVCLVNYGITLTPYNDIHTLINELLQKPLLAIGTGLPAVLLSQFFAQLLWFLGLHGDQIVGSVFDPILNAAGIENLNAYQAGDALPYIITEQFRALFVMIAFMSLVIAVIIVARSQRLKQVGKVSALPALFCISEPIVFGVPVVMNVILFIPWVICRPLFALISWLFMYFGLCPAPTGAVIPWTTPPILSGFLATNSIMGAVVQIVCLVVGVLLFIPFVRVIDKQFRKEEQEHESILLSEEK